MPSDDGGRSVVGWTRRRVVAHARELGSVSHANAHARATARARMAQNMTTPLSQRSTIMVSSTEKRRPGRSMTCRWLGFGMPVALPPPAVCAPVRQGPDAPASLLKSGLHASAAVMRWLCT